MSDKKTMLDAFKELATTIKTALSSQVAPVQATPAPAAMSTDYPLADGTVLTIDTLAVGGMVTIGDAPAPDAEYVLADGTNVTVVGGSITEIESAEAEDVEPVELDTPEQMQSALQKFADGIAATPTAPVDMQKMVIIMRAVFEYCFGYDIRRAKEEADRNAAIAVYQTGFSKIEAENKQLKETLKTMLSSIEKIAELPVSVELGEQKNDAPLTEYQKHQLKKAGK